MLYIENLNINNLKIINRDTSLFYLFPAVLALYFKKQYYEYRFLGFFFASIFAFIHHGYEVEKKTSVILNYIDILFAINAFLIEIIFVPFCVARLLACIIAGSTWIYQKFWFIKGTNEQKCAHIIWHTISSFLPSLLMIFEYYEIY